MAPVCWSSRHVWDVYGIHYHTVKYSRGGGESALDDRRKKNKTGSKPARAAKSPVDPTQDWAQRLIGALPDLICLCRGGRIEFVNSAGGRLLGGRSPKSVIGRQFTDFVHADSRKTARTMLRGLTAWKEPVHLRILGTRRRVIDAAVRTVDATADADGVLIVQARDITERKRAEEELRNSHEEMEKKVAKRTRELTREIAERGRAEKDLRLAAMVIEATSEAVVITDAKFRVTSVNPSFTEMTGYRASEVKGKPASFYNAVRRDSGLLADMRKAIKSKGRWEGEFWNRRKNNEEYAARLSLSAITNADGRKRQYVALINDITKRKHDEENIRRQANYDSLTGLPNRELFLDRLSQSLSNMSRAGQKMALMFLDLDGFKLVNDTLGHNVGDLLLRETSRRLSGCVRDTDTVARLGGDEFTVIMPSVTDTRQVPVIAQRVLDSLSEAFVLDGHETFVSCSIGITIFPDAAADAVELLKNADSAMYRAKDQGKANYQFYTSDLNEQVKERLVLKNGLVRAKERGELSLHYQPKLDILSGRITGVEALMRWNSLDLGSVPPAKFIPVLEETGMVVDVGEWAIRTACRQHIAWCDIGLPPIRIAVNLSARQLREHNFVSIVQQVLMETGVGSEHLEIEITESMLMSDTANVVTTLGKLHDLGICIAMDDFGTGYSSLSYLKQFPIDTIKIDRSFINDIATDTEDVEIVKAIITMGQSLNRKIVAEGVETADQISILKKFQCDEIQGYVFSRPLPGDTLAEFFKKKALQYA